MNLSLESKLFQCFDWNMYIYIQIYIVIFMHVDDRQWFDLGWVLFLNENIDRWFGTPFADRKRMKKACCVVQRLSTSSNTISKSRRYFLSSRTLVTCHVNLHQGYETPIYFPYHQGYDFFTNRFVSRPKEKLAKSCLKPWRSWENSTFGVEVESCCLFFEKDIFWTQKVLRGSKVSRLKRHDVSQDSFCYHLVI